MTPGLAFALPGRWTGGKREVRFVENSVYFRSWCFAVEYKLIHRILTNIEVAIFHRENYKVGSD
jgi:hypothetical protein